MAELENQEPKVTDTEDQTEVKTDKTHVEEPNPTTQTQPEDTTTEPSLEDVLTKLAESGSDKLLNLAPVKELIQTARKQEKDKLYKSIEQKDKEAKDLQSKLEEATNSIKKFEEDNLSAEEKIQNQVETLRLEHEKLVQQLQDEKTEAEKKAKAAELNRYKSEKLREAGDEIIPELVTGETAEEIDANIEKAKAKYQEIAGKFEAQAKERTKQEVKETFQSKSPSSTNLQPLTKEEIAQMSREEYAKNRERILDMIRKGEIE